MKKKALLFLMVLAAGTAFSQKNPSELVDLIRENGPVGYRIDYPTHAAGGTYYFHENGIVVSDEHFVSISLGLWRLGSLKEKEGIVLVWPGLENISRIAYQSVLSYSDLEESLWHPIRKMSDTDRAALEKWLTVQIDYISASTALPDEAGYRYGPDMAFDGIIKTAWNEGSSGNGSGEIITLKFSWPVMADGIDFMAGYFEAPYFKANNRVRNMSVELISNRHRTTVWKGDIPFDDEMKAQTTNFDTLVFDEAVFTVESVYPGEKWNDLAIAEISFHRNGKRIPMNLVKDLRPVLTGKFAGGETAAGAGPAGADAGGEGILFVSETNKRADVYRMSLEGGGLKNLTNTPDHDELQPVWSSTAELVAFTGNRSGLWHIYTMAPDGGDLRQITGGKNQYHIAPAWSPDGSRLAYITYHINPNRKPSVTPKERITLDIYTFTTGNTEEVAELEFNSAFSSDFKYSPYEIAAGGVWTEWVEEEEIAIDAWEGPARRCVSITGHRCRFEQTEPLSLTEKRPCAATKKSQATEESCSLLRTAGAPESPVPRTSTFPPPTSISGEVTEAWRNALRHLRPGTWIPGRRRTGAS